MPRPAMMGWSSGCAAAGFWQLGYNRLGMNTPFLCPDRTDEAARDGDEAPEQLPPDDSAPLSSLALPSWHYRVSPDVVRIAGPVRACYIEMLTTILYHVSQQAVSLPDRVLAKEIGISQHQVMRARLWWRDIGVVHYRVCGLPPTVEYQVWDTVFAWESWRMANQVR